MSETENNETPNEINELEENPHVKSDGDVLKQKFTPLGVKPSGPSYRHPQETAILTAAKETLIKIPFGAHLLNFAANHSVPMNVIAGKDLDFLNFQYDKIILICPLVVPKDSEYLALFLGLGIRNIEHKFLGWALNKDKAPQSQREKDVFFTKFIDNIMTMCKIVHEFKNVNKESKLFDLIKLLNYSDIYEAYVNKESIFQIGDRLQKKANK
jgi:hypothetical protein